MLAPFAALGMAGLCLALRGGSPCAVGPVVVEAELWQQRGGEVTLRWYLDGQLAGQDRVRLGAGEVRSAALVFLPQGEHQQVQLEVLGEGFREVGELAVRSIPCPFSLELADFAFDPRGVRAVLANRGPAPARAGVVAWRVNGMLQSELPFESLPPGRSVELFFPAAGNQLLALALQRAAARPRRQRLTPVLVTLEVRFVGEQTAAADHTWTFFLGRVALP
jgi:hypothetical protein